MMQSTDDRRNDGREAALGPQLSCSTCREWLHSLVEGEAHPLSARALEAHLERCPDCARARQELEEERVWLVEALVASPRLSPRFAARVRARIERAEAGRRRRLLLRAARRIAAGAAAAAALLWFALVGYSPGPLERAPVLGPVVSKEPCPAPVPDGSATIAEAVSPNASLSLVDSIDFSASFFRLESDLPCTRDVNRDGETDVSDAAHLFMLAVAPPPVRYVSGEEVEVDCSTSCRI